MNQIDYQYEIDSLDHGWCTLDCYRTLVLGGLDTRFTQCLAGMLRVVVRVVRDSKHSTTEIGRQLRCRSSG